MADSIDNTRVSGCDIFGSLTVEGNGSVLFGNRIQGAVGVPGATTRCDDNSSFQDLNQDRQGQALEVGLAVTCG